MQSTDENGFLNLSIFSGYREIYIRSFASFSRSMMHLRLVPRDLGVISNRERRCSSGDVAAVVVVITRRDLSSPSIAGVDRYLSEHEIRDRSKRASTNARPLLLHNPYGSPDTHL